MQVEAACHLSLSGCKHYCAVPAVHNTHQYGKKLYPGSAQHNVYPPILCCLEGRAAHARFSINYHQRKLLHWELLHACCTLYVEGCSSLLPVLVGMCYAPHLCGCLWVGACCCKSGYLGCRRVISQDAAYVCVPENWLVLVVSEL